MYKYTRNLTYDGITMSDSTRPTPGGALSLDDIVGRDETVDRWLVVLRSGSGLLSEPRRLGKTQALKVLKARAPADEWTVVVTSFQAASTLAEMAETAIGSMMNAAGAGTRMWMSLKAFGSTVSQFGFTLNDGTSFSLSPVFIDDPLSALEKVLVAAARNQDGSMLLLAWDEVPDMVSAIAANEGKASAIRLLRMLRRWREDPRLGAIRWILTGSVGLHHVVRQLAITVDVTNDLQNLRLGPLGPDDAAIVARKTLRGAGIIAPTREVVLALVEISDGIPFVIHLVAAAVEESRVVEISAPSLEATFLGVMRDLDHSKQLTPLLTRVSGFYGPDDVLAESLLDHTCTGSRSFVELCDLGAEKADASVRDVERVLGLLVLDHYLVDDGSYRWRYDVLRRFWALRTRGRRSV